MPITRKQVEALLNASEMPLYDDSRINALRKFGVTDLQKRVDRARRARDRAKDLVQKQKLASRASTGSKRGNTGLANERSKYKAELLGDILKRFEGALKVASKRPPTSKPATASRKPARKSAAKAPARGVSRLALRRKVDEATPAKPTPAQKAAKTAATDKARARAVSAKKRLLAEKKAKDRAPKPWQALDGGEPQEAPAPGFQSASAARKAERLHAGQSRMKPIQGSISTRGRRTQGKLDSRR